MIHVLHLLTCLRLGGAERIVADLVASSEKSRFRHTVCHLHGPDDLSDELRRAGCDVICLDSPERHGWRDAAAKLKPILARIRPDVVHSATFAANVAARLAVGRKGVPLVSWLVSMEYDPETVRAAGLKPWKNEVFRFIDGLSARYAGNRFVACSDAVLASATDRLRVPRERIEVIYNPVNLDLVQAAPGEGAELRRSLGIPDEAVVYFNVGRMDAPKAQGLLIEAFREVSAARSDAWLVLVGRGVLEQSLHERVQALGLADRVRFVPFADRVAPFLDMADVFVFPSLLEGLPVALLEAMCVGLPVIASDIAPHLEVIEDGATGLIVPAGSAAALAAAMERLHADKALRGRLGGAGREQALARFTTRAIVPQWEQLFTRLAGRQDA